MKLRYASLLQPCPHLPQTFLEICRRPFPPRGSQGLYHGLSCIEKHQADEKALPLTLGLLIEKPLKMQEEIDM
jgi:hypothetical protein